MAVKTQFNSMADVEVEHRGIKRTFLDDLVELIQWKPIERILAKSYKKTKNAVGNSAYPALPMFKVLLVQRLYNLSDPAMEEALYDRISFTRFCGFSLSSDLPDHSTICRFRQELLKTNAYERLFNEINRQLASRDLLIKEGVIVDATVVQSSRRPRKTEEEVVTDREEEDGKAVTEEMTFYSADHEARFLKKRNKLYYGYKAHVAVEDKHGFIIGGHLTSANVSDMNQLEDVLTESGIEKGMPVFTDKGYASQGNRKIIKQFQAKDRIMKKAARNRELSKKESLFNKLISKIRYKVERSFGSLKKHLGFDRLRYIGKEKAQMEFFLVSMCHNLKKGVYLSRA